MPPSPPELPLDAIRASLDATPNLVLVAPPGAGKTTLVPLALLDARFRKPDDTIVVLEPRRIAARAAATRMAFLLDEPVGATVGYRTRDDRAVSAATRIEVATDGILLARLMSDPTLDGIAAVLIDEIHERRLDADLALALLLDLQRTRPELRLVAMSATADARSLSRLLHDAPIVETEGRAFHVELHHATRDLVHPRELPDRVAAACRHALAAHAHGDVLAFLPGKAEIARTASALQDTDADLHPLHGDLSPDAQAALLAAPPPESRRRVVLATSIAETSLTVPGVRIVVDGGFRRAPRLDPGRGLSRLETLRIARAAATQRAGRAGREADGHAYRLWTRQTDRALPPHEPAEIAQAELSAFRLALAAWHAAWGTPPETLAFPDPPPAGAMAAATSLLHDLGALDETGALTDRGARMSRLGTHPRLAAMLIEASDPQSQALACRLAALLEERDPLAGPGRDPGTAEIAPRLDALARDPALRRLRRNADAFARRLSLDPATAPAGDPAALLVAAFPDRIAQNRGERGAYRLSGGGSASLSPADPLATATLLVAPDLHLGRAARITLAAPLDPADLPACLLARATETEERGLDPATGRLFARSRLRLGALILHDRMVPIPSREAAAALAAAASDSLDTLLDWTDAARNLQSRATLANIHLGTDLPDLAGAALAADATAFLGTAIETASLTRLADLKRLDVASLLRTRLRPDGAARLDRLLPTHLDLPHGRAALDYTADPPVASAKAQAFYGLDRTPVLADGRIRITLSLLSPANRPAARTGDLPSFWRTSWPDARRDLKGRYPRHDWPERPWDPAAVRTRPTPPPK